MKKLGKILGLVFAVTLVLVLVVSSGGYLYIRRSFPTVNGTVQVPGLYQPVEVIRDRWGVPHIYAGNNRDLFFAQGYVHAQDRLWQMELNRRTGNGTLSEVMGEGTLGIDKFLRTVGLRRAAEKDLKTISAETHQFLQDYANGVNAFIETHRGRLPLEFVLLGFEPAPWMPADTLVWGKVMALDLGGNWETEMLRAKLIAHLGEEMAQDLIPPYPDTGPFIIPPEARSYADLGDPSLESYEPVAQWLGADGPGIGSNNWVVDGSLTASGKPLLANDTHLGIQMPSIWYEMGLHGGDFDVVGFTFPGAPAVIIGHNDRIAWGVTNLGPDVQDLYLERINPENPTQYEFIGRWEDIEIVTEEIQVKDQESVILKVRVTRHGPLLNDVIDGLEQPTALRWTALDAMRIFDSVAAINVAADWESFREALRYWDAPSQNFVYADVEGNIGYQSPGRIPIRAQGDGTVPVPGWTGEYEWTGYIPFDELPFVYNPPTHFVVTANHKVVPDDYPYLISSQWTPGYRAQRIVDLLTAKAASAPLTVDDMRDIQADLYSLPAESLTPYILGITPEDELQRRALEQVRGWDGDNSPDSPGAAIVAVFAQEIAQALLADELGDELFDDYGGYLPAITAIMADAESPWLDDVTTSALETRQEIAQRAFAATVERLNDLLGDRPNQWAWGRLHTATFVNQPLGVSGVAPLERLANKGPFPMGGSGYTVNNTGYNREFEQRTVASQRQIVDLSNWSNSRSQHTTGQSGQPMHKHYADMIQSWRDVEHHPMLFDREQVEAEQEGRLILEPTGR
jgi:penicillin amidase